MKKFLFALLGFTFVAGMAQAQEDGAKLAKGAGKALTSYNIDRANNGPKLDEARQKINEALKTPEGQAMAAAWITKGDIYSTTLERDMAKRMINPNAALSGDNDALDAFNAYVKGFEIAEKKYEKTDALKGITIVQAGLVNIGVAKYEAKEYDKAYQSSLAALKSHELLTANKEKSLFEGQQQLDDQQYFTGLAAMLAGMNAEARPYFENMVKKGGAKAEVYESLYNTTLALNDTVNAKLVLSDGRKNFPDNPGLLFAEINNYLREGKLDELTTRLKQAIAQEPGNVSLYINLGNVYDNLQQRETKAKNDTKAAEYFEEARKYYLQGTEKDAKSSDAHYMLGALYYNKAAAINQEMTGLDNSQAALKRYKTLNDQMLSFFDQALPHFQKAENLDPNDLNTLLALSEIYARKEDELSLEFKRRLDVVKTGGKNDAPHFKQ